MRFESGAIIMDRLPLAEENLIFRCVVGSRAYGISNESSDTDRMSLFIAPPIHNFGVFKPLKPVASKQDGDHTTYELDKFIELAIDCNPNVIELFYTGAQNIEVITPWFERIRDNAHLFLSTKAKHTFSGYAAAQLNKMRGHHKWINNPQPVDPLTMRQYSTWIHPTGEKRKIDASFWSDLSVGHVLVKLYGENLFTVYADSNYSGLLSDDGLNFSHCEYRPQTSNPICRGFLACELDQYKAAHDNWKNYWKWKKNRNPARAELEERHGYDTKHASHLVRLLRMAREILTTGKVVVTRSDAEELKAIRAGQWKYDDLVAWAKQADQELGEMYDKSDLRKYPDLDEIAKLVMNVKLDYWRSRGLI